MPSSSMMCSSLWLKPSRCRPGRLLQFTIGEGGLQLESGELVAAHLIPVGQANQHRCHADISSKVQSIWIAEPIPGDPCSATSVIQDGLMRACICCSQIVFQHMARHQPLTVDMLLASVSMSTAGEGRTLGQGCSEMC